MPRTKRAGRSQTRAAEQALARFRRHFNCAESVLAALAEAEGVDSELIPKVATPFGGGIARQGLTCGALTGACMALGLRYGRTRPVQSRTPTYSRVVGMMREFRRTFGSTDCRRLIGFDIADHRGHERAVKAGVFIAKCPGYITAAVRFYFKATRRRRA